MALSFNVDVFAKFKALAISKPEQIEIGTTYYSNGYPEMFTVVRILTDAEYDAVVGITSRTSTDPAPRWIEYQSYNRFDGKPYLSYISLLDRNIGASYNPWLIFAQPWDRADCVRELIVSRYTSEQDRKFEELLDQAFEEIYDYPDEPIDPFEDTIDEDDGDRQAEHDLYQKGWR